MDDPPRELETLVTTSSEVEAHAIGMMLEDAGIEAIVLDMHGDNQPLGPRGEVSIKVRPDDLPAARAALDAMREASREIDWDNVDVGEREGDSKGGESPEHMQPARRKGPPMLARVSFIVAAITLLVTAVAVVLVILF